MSSETVYIDGEGLVLGRLASEVAKMLLEGKRVIVFNTEKVLVSGDREYVINEWLKRLELKSVITPELSPKHQKRPDHMFRRTVRGMLPRYKPKGRAAFRLLKVYHGVPEDLKGVKAVKPEDAVARGFPSDYVPLGDIARAMGWEG